METKDNQMSLGTWERLPSENLERKEKVLFEVNIPQEVTFISNDPREYQGENNTYYVFDVKLQGSDKVIMTSSWTLLRALKILSPLKNKKVKICKRLIKGKQQFEVIQV